MSRVRSNVSTTPSSKVLAPSDINFQPETPAPIRARLELMSKQISDLVRQKQSMERKHTSDRAELESKVKDLEETSKDADMWKKQAEIRGTELGRMKTEGEIMRDELNLCSMIHQQKALLAVNAEQQQLVELQRRMLQAETARVMRDHKLSLFKAREDDLVAEMAEKDAQLADLEAALREANTSAAHQKAAQGKAERLLSSTSKTELSRAQVDLEAAQKQVLTLEAKVRKLEGKVDQLTAAEKSAREETRALVEAEKGKGSSESERRDMQKSLRELRSDVDAKAKQLADVEEELDGLRDSSREREKSLKGRIKEATLERDRLLGIEEELDALKATHAKAQSTSPRSKGKSGKAAKVRKATPSETSEEEEVAPKKKAKKTTAAVRAKADPEKAIIKTPTADADALEDPHEEVRDGPSSVLQSDLKLSPRSKKSKEEAKASLEVAAPSKPKIRRFGPRAAAAFEWDPVMSSGDGVIPSHLSPMRLDGKKLTGTIPRLGFQTQPTGRKIGRLN